MPALIEIHNLIKHYPSVKAVDDVSFSLDAGRCLGLLGPNGAGKTTTIEILEGIKDADSGTILYKGQPVGNRFQAEAGIMFQSTALQDFISVHETLIMFSKLYTKNADLDELIRRCNLQDYLDQDNRKLSGGQRQRLLLAISLVNDPEIIFLDEPTTGLDPQARRNFWDLIETIKTAGKTVIITTHYMDEAYTLCDEIAIMDHGKIIAHDSPENLLAAHFNDVIVQLPRADIPDTIAFPFEMTEHNDKIEITTNDVNLTIKKLIELNISLASLNIRSRNLDDLFLELTGKELRT